MRSLKVVSLVLFGAPVTKKNHGVAVPMRSKRTGKTFHRLLPSEEFRAWEAEVLTHAPVLKSQLRSAGLELPIDAPVAVKATWYRRANVGDFMGYAQALGDVLQAPRCDEHGKTTRKGLGIIEDDKQIQHWDGSRMLKDAKKPRIEIELTILEEWPAQQELALVGAEEKF